VLCRSSSLLVVSCSQADCSGIWLVQALEQLPGFGFELAQVGEVRFGVPVCHNPFLRSCMVRRPPFSGLREGRGEQADGPGALHGLAAVVRAELAVQVPQVGLDRVRGR